MGVYYYFFNSVTGAMNKKPIPGYGQCHWVAKFPHVCTTEQMINTFEKVIELNGWSLNDEINACPDSDSITITYKDGTVTCSDPDDPIDTYPDYDDSYFMYQDEDLTFLD